MKTIHLKSGIHEIVDNIQSEQLLQALYDFLKTREDAQPGALWKSLTESQRQEVIASFAESEDQNNLLEANKVFKNMR